LRPYIPDASELSEDPDDWLYLACALRENAAIWTHDKDFSGQLRVRILSTKELAEELGLF
jgi:predicted nucleic acid-binding protein